MADWLGVDVTDRTCTVGDCGKPFYAKGMCAMHYQRARLAASTETCVVDGCSKPVYARKRGICRTHYNIDHDLAHRASPERREQHRQANLRYYNEPENRARRIARNRRRRQEKPEMIAENRKAWREANPERHSQLARENAARRKARMRATQTEPVDYDAILERDGMVCHICTLPIESRADLHFDHVIPLAKGGPHVATNIRPSHALCNMRKHTKIA